MHLTLRTPIQLKEYSITEVLVNDISGKKERHSYTVADDRKRDLLTIHYATGLSLDHCAQVAERDIERINACIEVLRLERQLNDALSALYKNIRIIES